MKVDNLKLSVVKVFKIVVKGFTCLLLLRNMFYLNIYPIKNKVYTIGINKIIFIIKHFRDSGMKSILFQYKINTNSGL